MGGRADDPDPGPLGKAPLKTIRFGIPEVVILAVATLAGGFRVWWEWSEPGPITGMDPRSPVGSFQYGVISLLR